MFINPEFMLSPWPSGQDRKVYNDELDMSYFHEKNMLFHEKTCFFHEKKHAFHDKHVAFNHAEKLKQHLFAT